MTFGRARWFTLLVVALTLSGCSAVLDVSGTWTGSATPTGTTDFLPLILDLSQSGAAVSGTITDVTSGLSINVTGTLRGNTVPLTGTSEGITYNFTSEVNGNTMSGTYSGSGPGVSGGGTFTATR